MTVEKYDPAVPEGYRLLEAGEKIQVGDIYWSTKWYRVAPTMQLDTYDPERHTRYARKIEPRDSNA